MAVNIDLDYELSKARTRLISRLPFFGRLAMQLKPRAVREGEDIPTAAIGRDGTLVANPDFISTLTPKQVAGVMCHEVLHPVLRFWARLHNRIFKLANIAHDLSFNPWIEEMSQHEIELPPGALLDPKFYGMSMEQIYAQLLKNGTTQIKTKGGGSMTLVVSDEGETEMPPGYFDCRDDIGDSSTGKKAVRGDKAAQDKLEYEWKLQLAEAAQHHQRRSQGHLPAGLKRLIEEILHPKVDWAEEIRRWTGEHGAKDDYSFARPHRRSEALGIYLPSLSIGGHADLLILIDSSGSMSKGRLERIIGEVMGVCEEHGATMRCIVCDAEVHADLSFDEAMDLVGQLKGGGGSNFNPAFQLMEESGYDGAVLAFTDGYITVPAVEPMGLRGTLWVTEGDEPAPTTAWGDHIVVPDSEYSDDEY